MKNIIFTLIFLLVFGLSITHAQQVYIAGGDGGNSWVGGNPVYWINGKQTVLPKIGEGANANAITVSDSDICIAGFDDGYGVVYWLNGKEQYLFKGLGTAFRIFGDAAISEIVGYAGNNAVYWSGANYRGLVKTELPKKSKEAVANAMASSGSKRYITGSDGDDAVYWVLEKKGYNYNIKQTVLPKKSKMARALAIAISGSKIYIAGTDGDDAVYWLNGKRTVLPKTGTSASTSGIAVSGSNVYIVGTDGDDAVYWLNGNQTVLPRAGTYARANGIAVSGSNIYIVGTDGDPDVNADAVYWLNEKRTVLPKTNKSANANAIFVTP